MSISISVHCDVSGVNKRFSGTKVIASCGDPIDDELLKECKNSEFDYILRKYCQEGRKGVALYTFIYSKEKYFIEKKFAPDFPNNSFTGVGCSIISSQFTKLSEFEDYIESEFFENFVLPNKVLQDHVNHFLVNSKPLPIKYSLADTSSFLDDFGEKVFSVGKFAGHSSHFYVDISDIQDFLRTVVSKVDKNKKSICVFYSAINDDIKNCLLNSFAGFGRIESLEMKSPKSRKVIKAERDKLYKEIGSMRGAIDENLRLSEYCSGVISEYRKFRLFRSKQVSKEEFQECLEVLKKAKLSIATLTNEYTRLCKKLEKY